MSFLKETQAALSKIITDSKALNASMDTDAALRTSENNEKLDKMVAEAKALQLELKRQRELDLVQSFQTEPEGQPKTRDTGLVGDGDRKEEFKSFGRMFTESAEFKHARETGARNVAPVAVKALYEAVAANGGAAVFSQRRTDVVDRAIILPTTLLDVINVSPTDSNLIEFTIAATFVNNAAEVFEYTAGNFGLKPESDMTLALGNAPVQTIPHWIRASRNFLADAPAMRNFVDTKLINGAKARLESQILNGTGTAPNLLGILNTAGIQSRTMSATTPVGRGQTTADTKLDTIRRAITDIRLVGGDPNGIVLNPADAEAVELVKESTGGYLNIYDPTAMRVWRTRVIENTRIAANTALVGDWATGATLYVREEATIRVSEHTQEDFIRNAIRILCELRAALATDVPVFFERITMI